MKVCSEESIADAVALARSDSAQIKRSLATERNGNLAGDTPKDLRLSWHVDD